MVSRVNKFFSRQKITKDTNLVTFFKPLYILLSLLGLFPYTIKFPTRREPVVKPESLTCNAICAAAMSLLLGTFCFLNIRLFVLVEYKYTSTTMDMMHINFFIETLMLIASGAFAYILTFKNRKAYIYILTKVAVTWIKLADEQVHHILKYFRLQVHILVFIWLPSLITLQAITFFLYEYFYHRHSNLCMQIVYTIVPEIVSTATVGCFYILMQMVVCLMKYIEQHCRKLEVDQALKGYSVVRTLSKLESAYLRAMATKRVISRAFVGPILLILMQVFYSALRQAHALYHGLIITRLLRANGIAIRTSCLLYSLAKLTVLASTGTMLKNEEIKIGQALHNIPTRLDGKTVLLKIQHFATLMQCHETEISIYGLFPLDTSLFFNIVTSVSTYLMILVQFDRAPEKHVTTS